jgi:hypothetical protein
MKDQVQILVRLLAVIAHVTMRSGSFGSAALGKCGDFVLTNAEFEQFHAQLRIIPQMEFIEKPNLRIGGPDQSLWLPMTTGDHGLARNSDPHTSQAAADAVNADGLYDLIKAALLKHPEGLTAEGMVDATGRGIQTISPRTKPMEKLGLLVRTKDKRKNRSGRDATIWKLPSQVTSEEHRVGGE